MMVNVSFLVITCKMHRCFVFWLLSSSRNTVTMPVRERKRKMGNCVPRAKHVSLVQQRSLVFLFFYFYSFDFE